MFESFNQSVISKTVFCQTGKNAEQVKFREALLRLCTYSTIPEDYALFSTQFWEILTPALQAKFNDVLHLLSTCAAVLEFNCCKLVAIAKPILSCHAKHNHKEASKVKSRVEHGYTAGGIFPYRNRTCTHCNPSQVCPYPNRNSRRVI